ncbi:ribosome biogenesis GTPase YlqF [Veillonella magna]|uniref:ribosome biogenesis GTPase YlqF n=1 Tax=Veillonella magna TaxID=464322 RepID=UPI0023F0DA88|nr:ribosome biogenesis GTPase YlqF [Veillonella magna]MBD8975685.1 ribosome biogenesis GTPase YlqF [Veillonella magna]
MDTKQEVFPVVHWFPGHMAKATRMIKDYVKKVDVVIELLDARIPRSSANPVITEVVGQKPHIIVLNKVDLADAKATKAWTEFFTSQGITVLAIDSKTGKGKKQLVKAVERLSKPIIDKWIAKGIRSRSVRTIILGIPNVGKSTLINSLAGAAATRTADKPGHTRGQQWVKIGKNLELLDTPGVLWPKLEDQRAAARLAMTGAISDDVYDLEAVMKQLLTQLTEQARDVLMARYKLKEEHLVSTDTLLDAIGRKRGCLVSGGVVDLDKARRIILNDYRSAKLGLLTLDAVDEEPYYTDGEDK